MVSVAGDEDDSDDVASPNCATCLHRMEPAGTTEHPYWLCPNCAATRIA